RGRDGSAFVPLLQLFWLDLVTCQLLDWFFFGDCSDSFRTFCSVYGFGRFSKLVASYVGQDQDVLLSVVESDE
ncbi:hypothetical protein L195_g060750, partial [Trifolium pratense]